MSLLLAFRLNSSFSRWWEARNLWGSLIVSSRSLMTHLLSATRHGGLCRTDGTKVDEPPRAEEWQTDDEQTDCCAAAAAWTLGFAAALKFHLRGQPLPATRDEHAKEEVLTALHRLLSVRQLRELSESSHPPLYALRQLRFALEGGLHDMRRPAFEARCLGAVESMVGCLTGCERILRTPCPPGYVGLLRCVCFVWMLMMPFTLVEVLGWLMIPVVSLTSLLVLAIEQIGVEIENPFGDDANDLPLHAYCLTVEADLMRALAEEAHEYRDFEDEADAADAQTRV